LTLWGLALRRKGRREAGGCRERERGGEKGEKRRGEGGGTYINKMLASPVIHKK
jgi:hypothetical protein